MRPDLLPPPPPPARGRRGLVRGFVALGLVGLGLGYWAASGGAAFAPETREMAESRVAAEPAAAPADVEVTRAESPTEVLVAPAPDAEVAEAIEAPVESDLAAAEPADPPSGLPETPLDADAALAALAPDLAAPAPETATDAVATPASAPGADRRAVTGDRVNVREGPGTDFAVVGQLIAGEEAEVAEVRDGWARVRVGGTEGWMSERFLGAPQGASDG